MGLQFVRIVSNSCPLAVNYFNLATVDVFQDTGAFRYFLLPHLSLLLKHVAMALVFLVFVILTDDDLLLPDLFPQLLDIVDQLFVLVLNTSIFLISVHYGILHVLDLPLMYRISFFGSSCIPA